MARPRLSERLTAGVESKLTLVSAPAGFGKTTLLAEWLAAAPADGRSDGVAVARPERQPARSVLDLPDRRAADGRRRASARARSPSCRRPQPPPIEAVLADAAQRARARVPNDIVLVLDDYHVDRRARHPGRAWRSCSSTCPPQVHLVIATRADPALPLARLRARGELVEIRAADLRFTPDEAAAYLNEVMGLDLTARDVAALEGRTEGWIAALQLAALSMQGRDDIAGFIAGFAGDDRYIVDYLVEEVLQRQPETVRSFLLRDLDPRPAERPAVRCRHRPGRRQGDAGGARSREPVPRPARRPPPVVSLPPPLRRRAAGAPAATSSPSACRSCTGARASGTSRTASASEAIRHALAGEDFERAADLVELAIPATAPGPPGGDAASAGSRHCPTRWSGAGPC